MLGLKNMENLNADCKKCFGLCCVALPFAFSADFGIDKDAGKPCSNLQSDFRCQVHGNLRQLGFRGCTVFDCFGAGQKVSQVTFGGKDWREDSAIAKLMFDVFPITRQLHEMLWYLTEALTFKEAASIHDEIKRMREKTEQLTVLTAESILELDVVAHRSDVNVLLLQTSELVRTKILHNPKDKKLKKKVGRSVDLIGAKLKGADLSGSNLRGAYLIAADLRGANLKVADLIGADFRDADLSGADFTRSIFLTQAQINSANGDNHTKLPHTLTRPAHWSLV